jgi:hypothetical protein
VGKGGETIASMVFWLFIKAVCKYWWALMSCAFFTLLGLYILHENKSNQWAVNATFILAGFCLFVACFLAWKDEHQSLLAERGKNSIPAFRGHFWRIVRGLSDSDVLSFDQFEQAMKTLRGPYAERAVTADFDLLAEVFIENTTPGLAQILHIQLALIVGHRTTTLNSIDELGKYALAKTVTARTQEDGFLGSIDVANARREPLPDLRVLLMGNTPLGYRNKADGWLLFRLSDINPKELIAKEARFELILHDSNGNEHKITKSLDVDRSGTIVRNKKPN